MTDEEATRQEEQAAEEAAEEEESAEAAAAEQEAEEAEGEEEEQEEEQPKKGKKNAQQRIRELTAKYRQTERELKELRRLYESVGPQQYSEADKSQQVPQKPSRDQFDDEDAYFEALADWKAEAKFAERDQRQKQETERQKQQRQQQEIQQTVRKINDQGMQEFEDYDEVVLDNQNLQISDTMVQSIVEMDQGHKVAYHLGHNPDKAAEIAKKSPYRQAIELAKLEEQLTAKKPKKKNTNAPEPTSPVKGQGEGVDPEPSDPDEWMNWYYRQLKKKKGK